MTDQKPSTPPAGPSGVSRPQDNHDVQQALRRVNDVIGGALRQIAAITGQPDPAPPTAPAPNHLDAMREAWGEGYYEGHANGRRKYDGDVENPYAKLLDDRREFVREHVDNAFGALIDEDGDNVLGDDNAEWFDAVLDAHDEWRALQQRADQPCRAALHRVDAGDPPGGVPCSLIVGHPGKHITASGRAWDDPTDMQVRHIVDLVATIREGGGTCEIDGVKIAKVVDDTGRTDTDVALVNAQIRAEQAEARVEELNSVLRQLLIAVSPGRDVDVRFEDMLNEIRVILDRAGYRQQPGGWVPPYSADTALGKIWHVLTESTLDRDDQRLNGVRDVLADMGYHEHVHTRLATADEHDLTGPVCGAVHSGHNTEVGHSCTLAPDHVGDHQHYDGTTWQDDDAPVELCGNRPPALTGDGYAGMYACTKPAGHDGDHGDGQYGVTWAPE
ncbi:hypothetical protein KNU17_gp58 [Gordonia phage Ailee]|uniref:Uncharacterized protein n=1 Tax=Gordonia phage Ailee TaxID=2483665 RepID=A0A3G3M8V5_9CAUD|nr:hypothetical protein KNU17_gp58 [Gordonia phage Ailee]AYR02527.1 hypothetical protein SEA_AILEE_58 [Gordonia phage Ailee]